MNEPGHGPMWWGICVVLAFTAAVSIRFAIDGYARAPDYKTSGGSLRVLPLALGTGDLTGR